MSFTVYELAVDTHFQGKLQKEIDNTLSKCTGQITYKPLLGMRYFDAVVSETLRKWPPGFPLDNRVCVKDYTMQPVDSTEKSFTVNRTAHFNSCVWSHRDPIMFLNPDKFDPERFNEQNNLNVKPASCMHFGVGPRSHCVQIGFARKQKFCSSICFPNVVEKRRPYP